LLTNILTLALSCAYLSANIQDYVVLSLEANGITKQKPKKQKTRIFNNLMKVLKVISDFGCIKKEESVKVSSDKIKEPGFIRICVFTLCVCVCV
jgi:hypothetical protein